MKNRLLYFILAFSLLSLLYGCKDKIHADFVYEPKDPKIGESVKFTNLSDGGEDFDWTFTNKTTGSVLGRSTQKDPSRIFYTSGEYTVTLRVDSNKNFIRTKDIFVYDSIPNISRDKQEVGYYESVTFKAIAYNPYNRTQTYQWFFSTNAEGENLRDTIVNELNLKVATVASPEVYFTQKIGEEVVSLRMTIGDSIYTTEQIKKDTFAIEDVFARSLLMARKGGNILRQRIFDNGVDEIEDTGISSGNNAFNLMSYGEELFIFDAGTYIDEDPAWETDVRGDGSIRVVNLNNDVENVIISNTDKSSYFGFYNGYADDKYIYWTDRTDFVYKLPKSKRGLSFEWKGDQQYELDYYVARIDSLGYGLSKGQLNSGIYVNKGVYHLAKDGSEKGIYRFVENDLQRKFKVLFPEYSIRAFVYDEVFALYYFSSYIDSDFIGFYVADMDGTTVKLIDKAPKGDITGIVVDKEKVYWSYQAPVGSEYKSGIKQISKLTSIAAKPAAPEYFNYEENIQGIALDNVEKEGK